ncbi:hypothetical protein F5B19DRAFT_488036 [Rostrohypoxylon terebratum]|nr:hypothetical protein F5B19DRAFT_488036 [Rostrohypoxylon terebratum]
MTGELNPGPLKDALPPLPPNPNQRVYKVHHEPFRFSPGASNYIKPFAPAPRIYKYTGTALGACMWFFLMYRAKKDGPVLLGWKHPWDH